MEENRELGKDELKKSILAELTSFYLKEGYSVSGLMFLSQFENLFKVPGENLEDTFNELLCERKIHFRDTKGGPGYCLHGDIRKKLIIENNLIQTWKKAAMNRPSYSMGISTGMYSFEEELNCANENIVCYRY